MLANYQRKSNIAGIIWLAAMLALFLFIPKEQGGNIWQDGDLIPQVIIIIMGVAWFYALWAYAKAKGHSGLWAAAGVLTLLGLVILLLLPDKHKNIPEDSNPMFVISAQKHGGRHMPIEKAIIVGTFLTCALALAFPPWGWMGVSENFQTFAFVFSDVPVVTSSGEELSLKASIVWPTLALEIGAIISIGFALYFLARKHN